MERRDLDIILDSAVNWLAYAGKTVLVTGATGRLGRYIIDALIEVDLEYNLGMKVVGLARCAEKAKRVFGDELDLPNVNMLFQDINEPIELDGRVDVIFHTAGPAAPTDFGSRPAETLWTHVNGTHNVLELARRNGGCKVIYVSTVEIYGEWNISRDISETDMGVLQHLNFRACYPEAKRICETMLASYKEEYGVDYCGVRLSHTLGPGVALDDGRGFAEFMSCALSGEDIVLKSDGSAMRTYTYVADAINALFLVAQHGDGLFYNVATDENLVSIRDLAQLIASLGPTGKVAVRHEEGAEALPYLPFKLAIMDTSRVRALGWKPKVGLRQMFEWTMASFS